MANRICAAAGRATAFLLVLPMIALGAGASAQTAIEPGAGTWLPFNVAQATEQAPPPAAPASGAAPAPSSGELSLNLDVVARALDIARQQIQPSLGASVYTFGLPAIQTQPQGENQSFNQLLLQAPGVSQDSFGQLHVRDEHANLQFRLNGIILPEGINVFGQALQTRLADSVSLITGTLPAQYGLRTAGIVDIQTKTGTLAPGGSFTLYGGSQGTFEPSAEWGGRVGQVDYYFTGQMLHTQEGLENPAPTYHPIHDISNQPRGFGYVSGIIDPTTRVVGIFGVSRSDYQIPQVAGQTPSLGLNVEGITTFPSAAINENQEQITDYGIVALQKRVNDIDLQISAVTRYSSVYFTPGNPTADILFDGIAQSAFRKSVSNGLQGDASWRISPRHTLRSGFYVQTERSSFNTTSYVLPVGPSGTQTSNEPLTILDSGGRTGWLYSYYLQDEWKVIPRLTVNFGARFDVVDEFVHEQQLSPRANLVWQPTDATTIHLGYARYFTPPPFELIASPTIALFANTTAAPAVALDSTPKAEREHYFDAGLDQIILDIYYKIASNLIDEGQFGAPILLTPFNYQKGLVKGVELTLGYDVGNWSFYGNFAAAQEIGTIINSSQFNFDPGDLAHIANNFIHTDHDQTYTESAGIKYRFPKSRTLFSVGLTAGSGLRATQPGGPPNGAALPGYQQVNLSIVQPVETGIYKGLELRFDIINLFDQVYQIRSGTGLGVFAPQFGPRRTFFAGITQRF
jgi:outer membrane receptor protein involved in Fe transport